MRILIPVLFGFSECAEPAPASPPMAIGVSCGDVAVLPADTFAVSAVLVGTIETEPEIYGVYAAPVAWEQVDQMVFADCPEEGQTEASVHSIVVYYAPSL